MSALHDREIAFGRAVVIATARTVGNLAAVGAGAAGAVSIALSLTGRTRPGLFFAGAALGCALQGVCTVLRFPRSP